MQKEIRNVGHSTEWEINLETTTITLNFNHVITDYIAFTDNKSGYICDVSGKHNILALRDLLLEAYPIENTERDI